jgi:HSP20 family protein
MGILGYRGLDMGDDEKRERKGVSGILTGVTDILDKLEKLAESGTKISRTGRFPIPRRQAEGESEGSQGAYGFSFRVGGLGGQGSESPKVEPINEGRRERSPKVEPINEGRRERSVGRQATDEVREPLVDVFDEDDRLLIVAEMPGIERPEEVHLDLGGRTLTLSAERADRRYRKSLEVPEGTQRERLTVSCKNGIIEVSAAKPRA